MNQKTVTFISLILGLISISSLANENQRNNKEHVIELKQRVLCPDDGLLLGNGDLSVSVYQTADRIVWRFGKGDVWDRRLDLTDDPKPAHISEIAHGIRAEGWKCPPYGTSPAVATRGTRNPKRMREICQGSPPSYKKRPYPCPKPVGEFVMQLPPDQMGLVIRQRLVIEQATIFITCTWKSGAMLEVESFIPPTPNVLVVRWRMLNWTEQTRTGNNMPPVWFSLYRWADPKLETFAAKFSGDFLHNAFRSMCDPKVTPLPPPSIRNLEGMYFIEQSFPPDPLFKKGFQYAMAPSAAGCTISPVDMDDTGEARLHIMPSSDSRAGEVVIAVATTSKKGGVQNELKRIYTMLFTNPNAIIKNWRTANRQSAKEFWSKSRLHVSDKLIENLWYETLYAQRCAYRSDTVPPGLFLPSTVQDYSHWHGDYHTNYNFQEPFWGDYTANHLELGDAYFQGMKYFLQIGRKIAHEYYNCRGVFIQLSGYPIYAEDDPLGVAPMGRMAYMTGWAMHQYWWHYLYTLNTGWLRSTGYPVIRDCALFYNDFLKKGTDGLYHAFPSNQGEDGFSGNPEDYTDRAQVMQHARYCLRAAISASEILNIDDNLRVNWRDRLEHCAGDNGQPPVKIAAGLEKLCAEANPPEFGQGRSYEAQPENHNSKPWPSSPTTWYFGQYPWSLMGRLRSGAFIADRDFPIFRALVNRWHHPNGLTWGMSIANYGHAGAWTETLGVIAPLQEMMLQSWDGALRIFPAWPKNLDARFEKFRAQGGFLVSAASTQGHITFLEIFSEKDTRCQLYPPWPSGMKVTDSFGRPVDCNSGKYERTAFLTKAGVTYHLEPLKQ